MNRSKNISGWQFAAFRIVFGLYLFWHFIALLPYGSELFSSQGVLPRASLNITNQVFPNILALLDTPGAVFTLLLILSLAALAFTLGWWRRTAALLLWYGWACLFNRNNLISNPGIPYVGLLLLFSALLPSGEPLALQSRNTEWKMPAFLYWGAWFLLGVGYAYSGVFKLLSPSWQDGSALHHLITNPLARPGFFRDLLLALPLPVLKALTWISVAGELAFLPLSLARRGRFVAWTWMLAMHLGILLVVDFADLTIGMLMIHCFTFDPNWFPPQTSKQPLLLFDGHCGLCNRAVQFFMREDTAGVLRYETLQATGGQRFLARHGLAHIDSMVLIEYPGSPNERAWTHSSAAIRTAMVIGGFWRLASIFLLVPRPIRDRVYRFVAANRYAWFGRAETACSIQATS